MVEKRTRVMTDRKQTLTELREKVAAGDDSGFRMANRAVFSTPCQDMNLQLREENCRHAYKGSLDAALALHNAVLPGWTLDQMNEWHAHGKSAGWYVCLIRHSDPKIRSRGGDFDIPPARAWLLAILSALIAQEEDL